MITPCPVCMYVDTERLIDMIIESKKTEWITTDMSSYVTVCIYAMQSNASKPARPHPRE